MATGWCHSEHWKHIWCLIWLSSASFEEELTDLFNLGQIYSGLNLASTLVVWVQFVKVSSLLHVENISAPPSVNISLEILGLKTCWTFAVNLTTVMNLAAIKCVAVSGVVTESFNLLPWDIFLTCSKMWRHRPTLSVAFLGLRFSPCRSPFLSLIHL